ncbi:unnamed protein product [Paramecium primaurelia]|uniref:Dehydrogenase/reductase SDR family member 4 n=2 Tax=Paramecium TaxID=5884 RepID=A0A8S1YE54_9CILI|nr:unnamed protein product [Paramecium primaurelia]CAD8212756.1 unnamed protein product [Paramecium pentaurelia]
MKQRFQNKVCLVTASSTGIGLAISEQFAREGATVIISSRDKKHIDAAVEKIRNSGGKAEGYACHAGKIEDLQKMIQFIKEKYGRLDILVPNAAVSTHFGFVLDMTPQQYDKLFEVNLRGVYFLIQAAYPLLKETQDSNIVIISSIGGYESEMGLGMYSVTKTALLGMTKVLSKDLAPIRVNCCAPGLIKTKFSSVLWEGKEQAAAEFMKVERLGVPEDIGNAVAFLASSEASYVNGETLIVAGRASPRL